jgi:hypothetical protein
VTHLLVHFLYGASLSSVLSREWADDINLANQNIPTLWFGDELRYVQSKWAISLGFRSRTQIQTCSKILPKPHGYSWSQVEWLNYEVTLETVVAYVLLQWKKSGFGMRSHRKERVVEKWGEPGIRCCRC